jgi:hypothetical protein
LFDKSNFFFKGLNNENVKLRGDKKDLIEFAPFCIVQMQSQVNQLDRKAKDCHSKKKTFQIKYFDSQSQVQIFDFQDNKLCGIETSVTLKQSWLQKCSFIGDHLQVVP